METDTKKKKKCAAPIIIAIAVALFAAGFIALILWAVLAELPPRPVLAYLAIYIAAGGAVIFGVIYCMRQRIREIKGGEEDEARKY